MISLPGRARARRRIAAGAAAGLALASFAVVRTTTAAHAVSKTTPYALNCTVPVIGALPLTTSITTSVPDTAKPGDSVMIDVKTDKPAGLSLDVPVLKVVITIPTPPQVNPPAPSDVMIMGGSLPGTATVSGSDLVVTLSGSVSSLQLEVPELMITSKVKAGTEGQTINWMGPSSLAITANVALLGGNIDLTCASGTTDPVGVTQIAGSTTTSTAPTTTTTKATTTSTMATTTTKATTTTTKATTTSTMATTTTKATTTTTKATTTSTMPTTTTTKATTTTSKATTTSTMPTTTTTKATTTTSRATTTSTAGHTTTTMRPPPHDPFLDFIRRIICALFHICR